ncbi:MAG: alpha/beta hydrolase [Candidatus Thiodiazotropha sp.]
MNLSEISGLNRQEDSSVLVVILHAYASSPGRLSSVKKIVESEYPQADFYIPDLPAGWASIVQPTRLVQVLLDNIDNICASTQQGETNSGYDKIILIGHSLGALLARKLYVCACGEISGVPIEDDISATKPRGWVENVDRIILLAGMNRGWRISHHLSLWNAFTWSIGSFVGNIIWLFSRTRPLIFSIKKGAPFITQLRIQWINMRNHVNDRNIGNALTIQLLGSVDDMVSPDDNIDLVSGHDFVYLDVPYSGHADVIEMNDGSPLPSSDADLSSKVSTIGEARASVFRSALIKSKEELESESILPSDLPLEKQNREVTDVVFVIHGIRDKGYWTHKIARRILLLVKNHDLKGRIYATETSSYGYFPMLPFLLPTKRREKVEWFMDQYAEATALYPNAEFSFVGHSNGTYLLTRSMKDYPVCRFKNVVLAGSVVRSDYNWKVIVNRGQVKRVLNYVATADWVVAFFPKAIQMLKLQDLGSAGHDGFDIESKDYVEQIEYVNGGHGAALNEANWEAIAKFVLTGTPQEPPPSIRESNQSWLIKVPGLVAPVIWLFIIIGIWFLFGSIWVLDIGEVEKTALSVISVIAIWKVVTVV